MYTYIIMLLISLFFAFLLMQVKKLEVEHLLYKNHKMKKVYVEYLLLVLSMAPFIFISGFRRDIGYDYTITYEPIFKMILEGAGLNEVGTEPGYYLLNKLIAVLGGGYVWVFLLTSTIIIALFWIGFYQQSKNICMSIVMFFCGEMFFLSMDGVRQFMGMAIGFYAFKYIQKKSFLKYALFVFLGCMFHKSTILLLPLYFFQYIKINPIGSVSLVVVGSALNGMLYKLIPYLMTKLGLYDNYLSSPFKDLDRIFLARVYIYGITFVIASIFYFVKDNKNNKSYILCYNMMTILFFISLNANIIPAANRVCWTFDIALLVLVPLIVESCDKKLLKYGLAVGIALIFYRMTYNEVVIIENQGVVPYIFTFMPYLVFK